MSKEKTSLKEKIARLKKAFVEQLSERGEEIERLVRALDNEPPNSDHLRDLHRALHSLKGTSASFGFKTLSGTAAILEEQVLVAQQAMGQDKPLSSQIMLPSLTELLNEMAAAQQGDSNHEKLVGIVSHEEQEPSANTPAMTERTLYLCDDEPLHAEQLVAQLSCFGYQTEIYAETSQLYDRVQQARPHAIIMDIVFPQGGNAGTNIVEKIHQELDATIPVIFLSVRNDFEARINSVQAGGLAYLQKPVKASELVEMLDKATTPQEPQPFKVLVIDDEPEMAQYHAAILQETGMTTEILNKPETVLEVLEEFKPDLVLMDMYMPRCTGRELAQLIRQIPDHLSLPIVYLSSETDTSRQFSALSVGADGFLTKPISPNELIQAVVVRAERMRTLRSLMVRDSLTGLYNHTATKQFLDSMVRNAERQSSPLCYAMVDVDRFKSVNDNYGHPAGDQVILILGRVLQQRLRRSDVVGRYGGEEFAVILQDTPSDIAYQIMDELREAFSRIKFFAGDAEFSCTFSCGIAEYPKWDSGDILNVEADKALYEAKRSGRNQVVISQAEQRGAP